MGKNTEAQRERERERKRGRLIDILKILELSEWSGFGLPAQCSFLHSLRPPGALVSVILCCCDSRHSQVKAWLWDPVSLPSFSDRLLERKALTPCSPHLQMGALAFLFKLRTAVTGQKLFVIFPRAIGWGLAGTCLDPQPEVEKP